MSIRKSMNDICRVDRNVAETVTKRSRRPLVHLLLSIGSQKVFGCLPVPNHGDRVESNYQKPVPRGCHGQRQLRGLRLGHESSKHLLSEFNCDTTSASLYPKNLRIELPQLSTREIFLHCWKNLLVQVTSLQEGTNKQNENNGNSPHGSLLQSSALRAIFLFVQNSQVIERVAATLGKRHLVVQFVKTGIEKLASLALMLRNQVPSGGLRNMAGPFGLKSERQHRNENTEAPSNDGIKRPSYPGNHLERTRTCRPSEHPMEDGFCGRVSVMLNPLSSRVCPRADHEVIRGERQQANANDDRLMVRHKTIFGERQGRRDCTPVAVALASEF